MIYNYYMYKYINFIANGLNYKLTYTIMVYYIIYY